MTTSKPCITWVEVVTIVLVCAILGACVYASLQNIPVRHSTTETREASSPLKIANTGSSLPMLVPIPVTPAPKHLKLVIIIPENHK